MHGDGALFWFDSKWISARGDHRYGSAAYAAVLPHLSPRERSGTWVLFDGDYLPPAPMTLPSRNPAEKAIADAVERLAGLAYGVAVFGYQKTDFAGVDAALRAADASGYIGMLSSPGIALDDFVALGKQMSLVPSLRIDERRLRRVDFSFLSDDALRGMGFEPDAVTPPAAVRRTPCVLVLDVSSSLEPKALEKLNEGIRSFAQELRRDPPAAGVELAIVCVGGVAGDAGLMMDWTAAGEFSAFPLRTGGVAALGLGLRIALKLAGDRKRSSDAAGGVACAAPWIVVATGGEPVDPAGVWAGAVAEARAAERGAQCVLHPIAIAGANAGLLQAISATPVRTLRELQFEALFRWLGESLRAVSRGATELPEAEGWALPTDRGRSS